MIKRLKNTNFEEFYRTNEYVAKTSPMRTHYHSTNPAEKWLWQQKKKKIKEIITSISVKNIIDLGCGDCGMLDLIPKEINYHGIDISPTQISYAKKVIKKSGRKNAKVNVGDILNLKMKDNSYDSAFICDVIEHVLDPQKLIKETKRIVRKNGYIILSVPNELMWETIRAALLRFPLRSPDHINSIQPKDIKNNFKKIEKQLYIPFPFSPQFSLIHIFVIRNVK